MSNERKCFVLMPFKEDFNNPYRYAIKPAAKSNGLFPFRADDETRPMGKITKDITKSIIDADIIVAEMTHLSPNVTYELGLAHAAKKRVIMITQKTEEIPFDLHDIRHITYNKNKLDILEKELENKIKLMLNTSEGGDHDFFPELQVMTLIEKDELKRLQIENQQLASLANGIEIITKPKFAYIFFNNRYIGVAPQVIQVNPYFEENIITVFALEHFEEYRIITKNDLLQKKMHITLARRDPELFPRRVNMWLKYIRKRPNDVVIGRAIATYLRHIGEHEEAIEHMKELLKICDHWSMIYNGIGTTLSFLNRYEEAIDYFLKVKKIEDSFFSYFNLACTYSLKQDFDKCLLEIQKIINRKELITQIYEVGEDGNNFDNERDFDNIRNEPDYCQKFEELNLQYKEKIKEMQLQKD